MALIIVSARTRDAERPPLAPTLERGSKNPTLGRDDDQRLQNQRLSHVLMITRGMKKAFPI
jgi:hypothetical protein